jgi:hypothetical protein
MNKESGSVARKRQPKESVIPVVDGKSGWKHFPVYEGTSGSGGRMYFNFCTLEEHLSFCEQLPTAKEKVAYLEGLFFAPSVSRYIAKAKVVIPNDSPFIDAKEWISKQTEVKSYLAEPLVMQMLPGFQEQIFGMLRELAIKSEIFPLFATYFQGEIPREFNLTLIKLFAEEGLREEATLRYLFYLNFERVLTPLPDQYEYEGSINQLMDEGRKKKNHRYNLDNHRIPSDVLKFVRSELRYLDGKRTINKPVVINPFPLIHFIKDYEEFVYQSLTHHYLIEYDKEKNKWRYKDTITGLAHITNKWSDLGFTSEFVPAQVIANTFLTKTGNPIKVENFSKYQSRAKTELTLNSKTKEYIKYLVENDPHN